MVGSCLLSMYTAKLLLICRAKVKPANYSDLGFKLYGKNGKLLVDIALICS